MSSSQSGGKKSYAHPVKGKTGAPDSRQPPKSKKKPSKGRKPILPFHPDLVDVSPPGNPSKAALKVVASVSEEIVSKVGIIANYISAGDFQNALFHIGALKHIECELRFKLWVLIDLLGGVPEEGGTHES